MASICQRRMFSLLWLAVASMISASAQADSEVTFKSLHQFSVSNVARQYFEEFVQAPISDFLEEQGIIGRRLVRSKSRGASGGGASAAPKDQKQICHRGLESCASVLNTWAFDDYASEGQWLQDVLRLAGTRRRRGTFLPEPASAPGCQVAAEAQRTCAETMTMSRPACSWVNLALNRTVTTSSDQRQLTASHAVDGLAATPWIPQEVGAQLSSPYWLAIDLGLQLALCRMVIGMKAVPTSLRVEGSSGIGTTWATLASPQPNPDGWIGFEFPAGIEARWVRVFSETYMSIYEVELYTVHIHSDRRLQDSAVHHECTAGTQTPTACCEACLECTTLTCVINMPNCSTFLSNAYASCSEIKVDWHCCKAIWWAVATVFFVTVSCSCWCWCIRRSRAKRREQQRPDASPAVEEGSKFEL